MSSFRKHLNSMLEQPDFQEEYEKLQPEFEVMKALIEARTKQNMTQKELAERSGIRQSNISRIEKGVSSPNISTLQKLAEGLGMNLQVKFVPRK